MRRINGGFEEVHGAPVWIDDSDDTVEDALTYAAPDESYLDSDDDAECEHGDILDHGHCIDCGEYVGLNINEDGDRER